ncbi:hypothetical protein FJZ36_18700, partial [Candidatus Poribacteria bacterium]|nr:hypothetical protein [Candidatus Poribacteria bacterium]
SGSSDKTVRLWDVASRREVAALAGHTSDVLSVSFSPDGRTLASGSDDNTVRLWDVASRREVAALAGHTEPVLSVSFSPDGRTLASGSYQEVRLWDVASRREVASLAGHRSYVTSVSFSPVGRTLASGSGDTTVRLWELVEFESPDATPVAATPSASSASASPVPALPPALSVTTSFVEPSGNDILDANEQAAVRVSFRNDGGGNAYAVAASVTLSGATGASSSSEVYIGEAPAGESRTAEIPLRATESLSSGSLKVSLSFREANGFAPAPVEVVVETRALLPPRLVLVDVGVEDTSGNGVIEPGEVVTLVARVQNLGAGVARGVVAALGVGEYVYASEGSSFRVDIGELASGEYHDARFRLFTAPAATTLGLTLDLLEARDAHAVRGLALEGIAFNRPVQSVQQVVVRGRTENIALPEQAGGLSIDIERDLPRAGSPNPNGIAVVFGVENYPKTPGSTGLPTVPYARRDAQWVKEYLVTTLGYDEVNVLLLTDQEVTKGQFDRVFGEKGWLERRVATQDDSDVFVYFSGHGAPLPTPDGVKPMLVPSDGDPNYAGNTCVSLDGLLERLALMKAQQVIVVLDSCFSGGGRATETADAPMILADARPVVIDINPVEAALASGVAVFSAASGAQVSSSYPAMKHGLFTYFFLKGLRGDADANNDKRVTVGEMGEYVRKEVSYVAPRVVDREQTPTLQASDEVKARVLR